MQRILITGAAGEIGTVLRAGLAGSYSLLRLLDVRPCANAGKGEEAVVADVTDLDAVTAATRDIDCVVHLAGVPREGPWNQILPKNVAGTYNLFEAARRSGVKRVIFASSNHVIGFYRVGNKVDENALVRPDSRYGVSKVFGEAVGRLYADKHGLSVACLRIGSFRDAPKNARELRTGSATATRCNSCAGASTRRLFISSWFTASRPIRATRGTTRRRSASATGPRTTRRSTPRSWKERPIRPVPPRISTAAIPAPASLVAIRHA
jgi:hypothetical protein